MRNNSLILFLFVGINIYSQKFFDRFQIELNCLPYSTYFNFKNSNEIHFGRDFKYRLNNKTGIMIGNTSSINFRNPFSVTPSKQYSIYGGVNFLLGSDIDKESRLELCYKTGYFFNYNETDFSEGILNVLEFRTNNTKKSFVGFGIKNYFIQSNILYWGVYSIFGITI